VRKDEENEGVTVGDGTALAQRGRSRKKGEGGLFCALKLLSHPVVFAGGEFIYAQSCATLPKIRGRKSQERANQHSLTIPPDVVNE
jgi:hypothetical protein